jgi:hypothetical protein
MLGGPVPGSVPWLSRLTVPSAFSAAPGAALRRLRPEGFGAEPTGERLARIRRSPNFVDGAFRNPVPTRRMVPGTVRKTLRRDPTAPADAGALRRPAGTIPVHPLTAAELAAPPASGLRLTWMGHATALVEMDGRRVLFDPVWGERCSPLPSFGPRRLHPAPLPLAELDRIDVVVVSHDHYDHLDMPTIKALVRSEALFAVPLGVGAHLELWGVPEERITELDWYETAELAGLTFTATPARH